MMKRIWVVLSLMLIPALGQIACSTGPTEASLEDTRWILESYGEPGNTQPVMADTEITAEFVSNEDTVKGSAGCNSYFGAYELKNNQLSVSGPIAVTEMYCIEPEGVMDQEKEYLSLLQLAEAYEINEYSLQIKCGGQVLTFKNG